MYGMDISLKTYDVPFARALFTGTSDNRILQMIAYKNDFMFLTRFYTHYFILKKCFLSKRTDFPRIVCWELKTFRFVDRKYRTRK